MLNKRSFWPVNAFPYVEPSVTNTKCTGCVALCELHLAPPAASEDVKLSYRLHRDAVAGLAFERVLVDDPVEAMGQSGNLCQAVRFVVGIFRLMPSLSRLLSCVCYARPLKYLLGYS